MSPTASSEAQSGDRRKIIIYVTVAVLIIGAIVAIGFASRVPEAASTVPVFNPIKTGDPAPEFAVSTTAGPFDLAKAGGKPTFLEVFATWCPHCQREVSTLNQIYAKYKDRVNIVAVSGSNKAIDGAAPETQNDVVNFATQFKVGYPIAFDQDLVVAGHYLQGGFPTMIIIGKDGKILKIEPNGEAPANLLEGDLDKALK